MYFFHFYIHSLWLSVSIFLQIQNPSHAASAPWQSPSTNVLEEQHYRDLPPIVFAPGGRLYSIEQSVQAATSKDDLSANLAIALQCNHGDTLVVVTTSCKSPHLHCRTTFRASDGTTNRHSTKDPRDVNGIPDDENPLWITPTHKGGGSAQPVQLNPPLGRLAPSLWMVSGGNGVDSHVLRYKVHRMADSLREARDDGTGNGNGGAASLSASTLARRLADHLHLPTLSIGTNAGRILASSVVFVGSEQREIWRVDPTGQFWKCHAAAIGRRAAAAEAHLIDLMVKSGQCASVPAYLDTLTVQEVIDLACQCIRAVIPDEQDEMQWQALMLSKKGGEAIRLGQDLSCSLEA